MGFISIKPCLFALLLLIRCKYSEEKETVDIFATCAGRKVASATILEEFVTSSEIECARACKNNKHCRSTNFIRHEICQLLYENANCNQLPLDNNCEVILPISTSDGEAESCQFDQPFNVITGKCDCGDGFSGEYCDQAPRDCSDFSSGGYKDIYLVGTNEKLTAMCYSAYLHILRFVSTSNAFIDYMHAGWNRFKSELNTYSSGRYWIGNDNVHKITSTGYKYKLETVALIDNIYYYGRYLSFTMDDEAHNYTVHFTGTDNLYGQEKSFFDNAQFRAPDYNSDNCTATFGSAWWYPDNCNLPSLFTGNYPRDNQIKQAKSLTIRIKRL